MTESLLIVTECNIVNNTVVLQPSMTSNSIREFKDLVINLFPGQNTYLTKESDSNESLIKSTTDKTKFLHVIENGNTL